MQPILSGLLAFILLFSGGLGAFFENLTELIDYAVPYAGEQTAQLLPADTDGYFTINLRPGLPQLTKMAEVLSHWLDNPGIKDQSEDFLSQLQSEKGINIEEDVLPWLGNEVALGGCHDPAYLDKGPIHTIIVSTFDRSKSDAFFFGKLLPLIAKNVQPLPTAPNGKYRGTIDTLYLPGVSMYFAFTDDYIIFSQVQSRLQAVLDLILDGGASLATTDNFTAARANLPAERMAMGYLNINLMADRISTTMQENQRALLQAMKPYLPGYIACSAYFVDDGIKTDYYAPTPEGMADYPFPGENAFNSANLTPANALGFFSSLAGPANKADVWAYRQKLTINNSASSENLIDFPILVHLTSDRIDWDHVQNAGQDIRFKDSDGSTELSYEIEKWVDGVSADIWVEVPQIDAGSTTDFIYMCYGNPSASDGQDVEGTWNSSYMMVQHLEEDPSSGAPQIIDSTANNNDGTAGGTMTGANQVTGKIDGSISFSGDDYVDCGSKTALKPPSAITVEAWVRNHDSANQELINFRIQAVPYYLYTIYDDQCRLSLSNNSNYGSTYNSVLTDEWTYVVMTWSRASLKVQSFIDSVLQTSEGPTPDLDMNVNHAKLDKLYIGAAKVGLRHANCTVDEVRVSNVARSADWIKTTWLSDTDSLVTYGTLEAQKSWWEWLKPEIAGNWAQIKGAQGNPEFPNSLDEMLAQFETNTGFNLEEDAFSWINGEVSVAVMPFTGLVPEGLLMFQVDNSAYVEGKIDTIVDGMNTALASQGKPTMSLVPITIGGRAAMSVQHPDFSASGFSLCYAFLDVDSTHYLVFSLTESAMAKAIDALNNPSHSLAQNADYQSMLASLPGSKTSLGYINIQQVFYYFLMPLPPSAPNPGGGGEEAEILQELLPMLLGPLRSLGMSQVIGPSGISGTMLLRVQDVDTRVYLDPSQVMRQMGEDFSLDVRADEVWVNGVSDLYTFEFHIAFDPDRLQVIDADGVTPGVQITPVLPEGVGGSYSITTNLADNTKGTIDYVMTLLSPAPPYPPEATLATIDFHCPDSNQHNISNIIFLNPDVAEPPVKLADSTATSIPVIWYGCQVKQCRLPTVVQDLATPQTIALFGLFKSNVGPNNTNFVAEANANLDTGGVGIAGVTVNLKELLLQMLPPDPQIPADRQAHWQSWLSTLEKSQLSPCSDSVYSRNFNLWEIMNQLPWYLGQDNAEKLIDKLRLGKFSVPVTVTDKWGNQVSSNTSLTIVDIMQPLKVGWNLASTPVRLDDAFATWADMFNLGDGLLCTAAIRYDPLLGWQNVAPTDELNPLGVIYIYATGNDQIDSIFSRDPSPPPMADLGADWNLVGLALSPTDWDSMPVNEAMASVEQDDTGLRGYSTVVSPGQGLDYSENYNYQDSKGRSYGFGSYGWSFHHAPWVYAAGSSDIPPMKIGGGYWMFMEHPDKLAGFSTTPVSMVDGPGYDLWNVPRYSGSITRTLFERYVVGSYTKIYIKYSGGVSPSQVVEFYKQQMPGYGWKLTDWEGTADNASLTFHKEIGGATAIFDCQINVLRDKGIDILYELNEPGVDLSDVPRFNWQTVVITNCSRDTNDLGTDTYIKYQAELNNFSPADAFKFYKDNMMKSWQFDGGECYPDHAWLQFHRTDNQGKTYNCHINASWGQIEIRHHAPEPIEQPKYGGVFNMGWSTAPSYFDETEGRISQAPTLYLTNEDLLMGDWTKGPAGSNQATWLYPGFATPSTLKGSLAESWEMPDPQTLVLHIRKGVHFQNKSPVNGRELIADDVVYSLKHLWTTSSSIHYTDYPWASYFQELDGGPWITAVDNYTVEIKCLPGKAPAIFEMAGDQSKIVPPEVADLNNWQNALGTGAFMLTNYASDNTSANFTRNSSYWMNDPRYPQNKLPYMDGVKYVIITDYATRLNALRTGGIDWLGGPAMSVQWQDAQSLMQTNPELKYQRYLPASTMGLFMRTDNVTLPFDDIRVRQALALAIDEEAIKNQYYGGNAEILASPIAPVKDFMDMYTPLDQLPQSTKELYGYNPEKAKQLLTEAGYPTGFSTEVICNSTQVDMLNIIRAYFLAIGVDMTINVKDMGAYSSMGRNKTYTQMYMSTLLDVTPLKLNQYRPGSVNNYSMINDAEINAIIADIDDAYFNEPLRRQLMKEHVPDILSKAYIIQLPEPYVYNFWQPWVRGYHGEWSIGQFNADFARYIWIDQDMKEKMTGGD